MGSGVRRVEAFVGMEALRFLARERAIVAELSGLVGARPDELTDRIGAMVTRLKDAERELERVRKEAVTAAAGTLTEQARDVNGVTFLGHDAGDAGADDVRTMVMDLRGRLGNQSPVVVAIAGAAKGRPVVVVATNEAARARGIRAGELVRVAATTLGGGGGGKDDIAQGGGQDVAPGASASPVGGSAFVRTVALSWTGSSTRALVSACTAARRIVVDSGTGPRPPTGSSLMDHPASRRRESLQSVTP